MNKVQKTPQSINKKQKPKMKKNANEFVDINIEKELDPKYKTEMCKSWLQTNFCVYGNKCRFAHGYNELFSKSLNTSKYKQKDCKSFLENGYCMYGVRCNFRHSEVRIKEIERSYFNYLLNCYTDEKLKEIEQNNNSCCNILNYPVGNSGMINNITNMNMNMINFNPNFIGFTPKNFIPIMNMNSSPKIPNRPLKKRYSLSKRLNVFEEISRKSSTLSDKSTENNSENEAEDEIELDFETEKEIEMEGTYSISSKSSNEADKKREEFGFNPATTNYSFTNSYSRFNYPFQFYAVENRNRLLHL